MRSRRKVHNIPAGWNAPFTTTPKLGWHLILFQNGTVALANLTPRGWNFGAVTEPASPFVATHWVGASLQDPRAGTNFSNALAPLGGKSPWVQLTSAFDHGIAGLQGRAVAFTKKGKPIGPSGQTGSEAVQTGEAATINSSLGSIADAITSPLDFLKWIAWIFHPLNILRAFEVFMGTILMGVGLWILLRRGATPPTPGRVMRTIIAGSPLGKPLRERQGRRMGTREGQREAARMSARQEATREQRVASARERASIEQGARSRARSSARRQEEGRKRSQTTRKGK